MSAAQKKLDEALLILEKLGMPRQQLNERTALCLLSLLDIKPQDSWSQATAPLMGITPIMDWSFTHYGKKYMPNTRETFRRQSMHQFLEAGMCLYNPDDPGRAVNSPKAVYQIEASLMSVLSRFGAFDFESRLSEYQSTRQSLADKYARDRNMLMVPVMLNDGQTIRLSPGDHSVLIRNIVEDFAARFTPNGQLVYVGDTGNKYGYFDVELLQRLGIELDNHGKLPDVMIYYTEKNWLILIESVTSHGPVDAKRYGELSTLFAKSTAGLVYVSAFPNRNTFLRYVEAIAWETEVWVADAPSHMIHFNGTRFLGPY